MESESTQAKDELMKRLYKVPTEILQKLAEAAESDGYIVTVHCKTGKPPGDLRHYYNRQNYPAEDFILSLQHVAGEFQQEMKKKIKWT